MTLRDNPAEWEAAAAAVGVGAADLRLIRQVHRADVAIARPGATAPRTLPEADVIVCDDPAVAVVVRVADCAPILIADRQQPAVAAIHAGWRGTMARAVAAGVEALRREFGSDPRDLIAAIGPCLGVCCGEVGHEVVDQFRSHGHSESILERWFSIGPAGRLHLNLPRANSDQLEEAGIPAASIHVADLCTRSYPEVFHSYRAAGPNAGRMAAVIRCWAGGVD